MALTHRSMLRRSGAGRQKNFYRRVTQINTSASEYVLARKAGQGYGFSCKSDYLAKGLMAALLNLFPVCTAAL